MRIRSAVSLGAACCATVLLAAGCSSSDDTPTANDSPTASRSACDEFASQVRLTGARRGAVVTLAATRKYAERTHQDPDDTITLKRVHRTSDLVPLPAGSTMDEGELRGALINAWNRTHPGDHFVTADREPEDDAPTLHPGAGSVAPGTVVWYRGWTTIAGQFRTSVCTSDGSTAWRHGTFRLLGVPSDGGASCAGGDVASAMVRAVLSVGCN